MESSRSSYCSKHLLLSGFCVALIGLFLTFSGIPGYANTFQVTNTNDSGAGSLRQAISDANANPGADEIIVDDVLTGTIVLTTSQLAISSPMTIQGPGAEQLAISGNDTFRVFYIDTPESVDISGLSIVSGNSISVGGGGGIFNSSDNLTVTDCTFSSNTATAGGGMYNENCSPTVMNCIFSSNSATMDGGGMYNYLSSPTVTNCTFSDNTSNNDGGGMHNYEYSSPTVTNCTFSNNSANNDNEGGGIYNYDHSSPIVTNCTFDSNTAYNGGGMFNEFNSSPPVTNCTFSSNTSYSGGGIYNIDNSSPTVRNCTFASNIATIGGGISNNNGSNPMVTNCIFWDECDFDEIYNANQSSAASLSHCIVQSDDYGTDTIILENVTSADPMLEALSDNGGPTETCALPAGSSAIDAGTDNGAPDTDQRGITRPQGSGVDIGAFEVEQTEDDDNNGGGCNVSTLPVLSLLLLVPMMFLSGKK